MSPLCARVFICVCVCVCVCVHSSLSPQKLDREEPLNSYQSGEAIGSGRAIPIKQVCSAAPRLFCLFTCFFTATSQSVSLLVSQLVIHSFIYSSIQSVSHSFGQSFIHSVSQSVGWCRLNWHWFFLLSARPVQCVHDIRSVLLFPLLLLLLQGYLYKRNSNKPLSKDWKTKKYVTLTDDARITYHPNMHVSVRPTVAVVPQCRPPPPFHPLHPAPTGLQDYMEMNRGKEIDLQLVSVKLPGVAYRQSGSKPLSITSNGLLRMSSDVSSPHSQNSSFGLFLVPVCLPVCHPVQYGTGAVAGRGRWRCKFHQNKHKTRPAAWLEAHAASHRNSA